MSSEAESGIPGSTGKQDITTPEKVTGTGSSNPHESLLPTATAQHSAREILMKSAEGNSGHFSKTTIQASDDNEQSQEYPYGERIMVGEHILSAEDSLLVEEGTTFYIEGLKSRIVQTEQALQDAEIYTSAESHASMLTTKGIEWIQQQGGQELPDSILASPGIREAYTRVAYLRNLITRVRTGDSDAMREIKSVIPRVPKFARAATKQAQIEDSLREQLVSAEEQAIVLSGDKPLDERESDSSAKAEYDEFAQGLIKLLGTEEVTALDTDSLDIVSVGGLVRLAAVGKLDYDLLQQKMRDVLEQKIKDVTSNDFDVKKQAALLHDLYSDPTLAGVRARQQVRQEDLDTKFNEYCQRLIEITKQRGVYLPSREEGKYADERFNRATLPGDTVLEHYTPIPVKAMLSGGLSSKEEHGMTVTNDLGRSNMPHFTSMAGVGGGIDYSKYATAKSISLDQSLRRDHNLEFLPGVFTISFADAVRSGKDCGLLSIKEANGVDVPEDMVLASHDGSPARFNLDSLHFAALDIFGQSDYFKKYRQKVEDALDQVRKTWDKQKPFNEYLVDVGYNPLTILREHLVADGVDPSWVEHNVAGSIEDAREQSKVGSENSVVIPLARARNTSFPEETLDSEGDNHVRLPLMYLGVGEAA